MRRSTRAATSPPAAGKGARAARGGRRGTGETEGRARPAGSTGRGATDAGKTDAEGTPAAGMSRVGGRVSGSSRQLGHAGSPAVAQSCPGSRTLNSSFQRRSSRVLWHQSSSVPTSVTCEWRRTGTVSPSAAVLGGERGLQRGQLLELLGVPAVEDRADGVVAAGRRAEEAEDGGLADDQAELGARDVGLGPFLHPHRHDAERLDRRGRRRARPGPRSPGRRSRTGPRRRGSGPPCRAGPGRNRRRPGPRPGRGRTTRARARAGRPSRRGRRAPAAELAALKTPPLNRTAEGRIIEPPVCSEPACWPRNRARCRVIAGSAA